MYLMMAQRTNSWLKEPEISKPCSIGRSSHSFSESEGPDIREELDELAALTLRHHVVPAPDELACLRFG